MIVVKTKLGLGNQMLQYALGRHLSIKHTTDLFLDISWYANNPGLQHPREFRLDRFCTKFKLVDFTKLEWKLRFTGFGSKINPFKLPLLKETDLYNFEERFLAAPDNVILEGFFSSYKYFEKIRKQLLEDFHPKGSLDATNEACLQRIKNSNSVSLHIRRGDYASTDFHGILPVEYYEEAIRLIAAKTGPLKLFVFSDEPGWVNQNMLFEFPAEVIDFNSDDKNWLDLELMKHCKHNIIANSSFSWWGAWLNENAGKIVVAPAAWYREANKRLDNIPPGWLVT